MKTKRISGYRNDNARHAAHLNKAAAWRFYATHLSDNPNNEEFRENARKELAEARKLRGAK